MIRGWPWWRPSTGSWGVASNWVAGLQAALAFLSRDWPPLALIGLATIVLGRQGTGRARKLIVPPVVAANRLVGLGVAGDVHRGLGRQRWRLPLTRSRPGCCPSGFWPGLAAGHRCAALVADPLGSRRLVERQADSPGAWLAASGRRLHLGEDRGSGLAATGWLAYAAGLPLVAAAGCDRLWSGDVSAVTRPPRIGARGRSRGALDHPDRRGDLPWRVLSRIIAEGAV